MITEKKYLKLKKKYDDYQDMREKLFPGKNYVDSVMRQQLPESITNDQMSSIEVYEFVNDPPDKYFSYIKPPSIGNCGEMITWMGELLGRAVLWHTWKSNFGDTRVSIDVWGINGIKYHGFYYKSAGDYCRITAYKDQGKG